MDEFGHGRRVVEERHPGPDVAQLLGQRLHEDADHVPFAGRGRAGLVEDRGGGRRHAVHVLRDDAALGGFRRPAAGRRSLSSPRPRRSSSRISTS